jgi:hypothetical protein
VRFDVETLEGCQCTAFTVSMPVCCGISHSPLSASSDLSTPCRSPSDSADHCCRRPSFFPRATPWVLGAFADSRLLPRFLRVGAVQLEVKSRLFCWSYNAAFYYRIEGRRRDERLLEWLFAEHRESSACSLMARGWIWLIRLRKRTLCAHGNVLLRTCGLSIVPV